MGKELTQLDEVEARSAEVHLPSEHNQPDELVLQMLELIRTAESDQEHYFGCLYYGEILMDMRKWEDSRDFLIRSAQIALSRRQDYWLVLSHEKLGDLSAAEGNWFGALHHYRYALRRAASFFQRPALQKLDAKANEARDALRSMILPQEPDIISLSREYASGNVAISFVHRDIYLKKYFARCLECTFCHDWCCSYGADIDIENVEKIQQHKDEILPFIRQSDGEWFEAEYTYYEEYAGNQYTRINTLGPRCVFISKDQRGCGLHRYALSRQMDYHEIKPIVCILFPLSFEEGLLCPAAELDDGSLICSGSGTSVYRAMRDELEYYFGHEFVGELDGIEREVMLSHSRNA